MVLMRSITWQGAKQIRKMITIAVVKFFILVFRAAFRFTFSLTFLKIFWLVKAMMARGMAKSTVNREQQQLAILLVIGSVSKQVFFFFIWNIGQWISSIRIKTDAEMRMVVFCWRRFRFFRAYITVMKRSQEMQYRKRMLTYRLQKKMQLVILQVYRFRVQRCCFQMQRIQSGRVLMYSSSYSVRQNR